MSILAKIKSWFFGETTKEADNADLVPYKMEPPTLDLPEVDSTVNWPFPTTKPEDGGVAKVEEAKPAKKPRAPAKPKAVKAKPAAKAPKPKTEAKPKAAAKTKSPTKS